jgi:hypothetical protein
MQMATKAKKTIKAKKPAKKTAKTAVKKLRRPLVNMEEIWDDFCEAEKAHLSPAKTKKGLMGLKAAKAVPPHIDWRMCKALEQMRAQINVLAPNRSKASDGGIGDIAHWKKGSASDHNPWITEGPNKGVVTARDFTHHPAGGCDCHKLVASLINGKDSRVKYVIWDSHIYSSAPTNGQPAWAKRAYSGLNKHNKHAHISVKSVKASFDDTSAWSIKVS